MRPIFLGAQPDSSDPFVNETSILAGTDVFGMINAARKDEIVKCATSTFQPCQETAAGGFKEFELNGPPRFLLNDDRS